MKVYYVNGRVTAEAENIDDVKVIMGLKSSKSVVAKDDLGHTKNHYTWRLKRRLPCDICGGDKGYKNLKLHKYVKHGQGSDVRITM